MCTKDGENWEKFVEYARMNGIEFRFPEDYEPFWKCWNEAIKSVSVEGSKKDAKPAVHRDEKVEVRADG